MDDFAAPGTSTAQVPAAHTAEQSFPPLATSVGGARRWARERIDEWAIGDLSPTAELLLSELASNAVLHARTPFRLSLSMVGPTLRVTVADESPVLPQAKLTSLEGATGRGLALIAALAVRHGVARTDDGGKTVWFELDSSVEPTTAAFDWSLDLAEPAAAVEEPAADPGPADAPGLVAVEIIRFPLQIFVHARQHQDDLVREFTLLALDPDTSESRRRLPARFLELIDSIGRRYAAATSVEAQRDAALSRGEATVDLRYDVPHSVREACVSLGEMLALADEFCRSEHLLTLETPPLGRLFRDWFLGEFVAQIDGHPPTPWPGPLEWSG